MLSSHPFLLTCYSLTKRRNLAYMLPTNCVNKCIICGFWRRSPNSSRLSLSNSLFRSARGASVCLDNLYVSCICIYHIYIYIEAVDEIVDDFGELKLKDSKTNLFSIGHWTISWSSWNKETCHFGWINFDKVSTSPTLKHETNRH